MDPGVDFDLLVVCDGCAGATAGESGLGEGLTESVPFGKVDSADGTDQSFNAYIEIRFVGATACGGWTLTVKGNTGGPTSC